ncbi:Serine-aspartate repeat-containing protein D precursor [Corynebacterium afermentans subsp. lipophilum]|nr:Serine-aspartate repeat-containing protein D precursor [Corynebacterium afermentans subsp. lipophilum]
MSENKRPNTRNNRWWRSVAAVVSTVALGIGGVAVPPVAGAYIQDDSLSQPHGDDLGAKPATSISVSPEKVNVQPGDTFDMEVRVDSEVPHPESAAGAYGKSDATALIVELQLDKRFTVDPSEAVFKWNDGQTRELANLSKEDSATTQSFLFEFDQKASLGANPGFTLTLPVTVSETAEQGDEIDVTVASQVVIRPTLDWTYGDFGLEETNDKCVQKAVGDLWFDNPDQYGTWLADLWLGSDSPNFSLEGDPVFKVTGPKGEDLTQEVFASADYPQSTLDPSESPEIFTGADGTTFENYRWLRRYEWRLNEKAFSGDIWIPEGSTVHVEQNIRSSQCAFSPDEKFGVKIESRNAPLFTNAVDTLNATVAEEPETPEDPPAEPPATVTESVTATTTVTTESVTATVTPTTVTTTPTSTAPTEVTTPTSTAPTEVTTPTSTAPTEVTTPTSTAPTEVTTPTSTAPTEVTTPTSTAGTVTTTVGTKTVTATTTPTTVTTTPTSTAPTVTVTPTATADCDCEPTTTTKTEKVPEPVPTTIHTTTTAEAPKRSSIGDKVWEDTNGDGKEDPNEKTGVPNVPVIITDKDGNEITRTVTDEDGNWKVDVEPGEYTVRYEPGERTPSDKEQVERTVIIEPGKDNLDVDLGVLPSGSVGDRVWVDEDGDGEQGEDEKGLENVVVLVSREGEPTRSAVTDANGDWKIEGLNPNVEYDIRFVKPDGWEVTGKVPGSDESGLASKVTVKPGEYNDTYDLGLRKLDPDCDCEPVEPGTIGDRVWVDENGDGKEDPDEKTGVPNVTVIVKDPEGNEVTRTVTDDDGNWKVDVEPGDYVVEYVPGGHTPSQPDQVKTTVAIKPGEKRDDVDLGVLPSGSVGDRVWVDEDGDGEQGEDEKGLENVVVLVSREGEPTRSAVTDENGDWKIEGLNPNAEYDIRFIKPEGWEVTGKVPGSGESGLDSTVTVDPGEYNDTYDLGLKKIDTCRECEPVKPGTIGNRVWIDLNGNGKQDPNETEGVPDVTVIVRDADGNEVTRTVTDEDGNWKVNVEPGDYEIEYRPRDWKPTDPKRVTQKVTVEEGKEYLDLDLGVQKPKPGEPTPPTDEPQPEKGSSTETLDRCVANAVRSPLLYLVPVALLGAFGGEIARPYMGAINEQVNQINAQFQEAMRRNSPDWGHGGRGGRDNDQFAELRGQIDAANRRIAELGQDPNVQRFGTVAAGIIGLIAAGGVLYDWCSNEKGEAFTSIGGSSAKESGAEGRQSSSKDAA